MAAQRLSRPVAVAAGVAAAAALVSGCGGGQKGRAHGARTTPRVQAATPGRQDVILSLAGLGTFAGRCPRGANSWTLRFVDDGQATDTVSYRVGTTPRHTVNLGPGNAVALQLAPLAARTHEPAEGFVPRGQSRGLTAATAVPTTAPIQASIYQATEPQTLRADVHLALATIGGASGQCALVASTVTARTYPNA
jgi:hypothetical protein